MVNIILQKKCIKQKMDFTLSTHQFELKLGLMSNRKTALSFFKFTNKIIYLCNQ